MSKVAKEGFQMMRKKAITRTTAILAIIIVIVIAGVAIYFLTLPRMARITGTVTAEDTGLPVEEANVTFNGHAALTDVNGSYSLSVSTGTYTVTVEKWGYVPKTATVDVPEAKEYTFDFVIAPILTRVFLVPSEIVLNVTEVSVGYRFNVTACVSNVTDLFGYQVALYYNASVINVTRAWQPSWNSSFVFYGQTGESLNASEYFDSWGHCLIGFSLVAGEESFNGTGSVVGLLAVFEFEIVAPPTVGLTSDLIVSSIPSGGTFGTKLKDSSGDSMFFTGVDGSYEYAS